MNQFCENWKRLWDLIKWIASKINFSQRIKSQNLMGSYKRCLYDTSKLCQTLNYVKVAASMVVEVPRICGRVGFVLGVTGWLGRAWWDFGAAWCYLISNYQTHSILRIRCCEWWTMCKSERCTKSVVNNLHSLCLFMMLQSKFYLVGICSTV